MMSVMSYSSSYARELTPDRAMERLNKDTSMRRASIGGRDGSAYMLNYTAALEDGTPVYYAFNLKEGDGFVLLSADDRMAPVLGVCDNAPFDYAAIPENMKWWLSQYADEVAYLNTCGGNIPAYRSVSRGAAKKDVSPLVSCRWDQDWPYSLHCPKNGGVATGCVATAMAQVMYYHKYAQGAGSYTYTLSNVTGDISYDFSALDLDWSNMSNYYNSSSSQVNCDAVAELMYACGVSVHMMYTSSESSAFDFAVPRALYSYFGYDGGVRYVKRDYFTDSEWEDMIYAELEASRPFIYGGSTPSSGGHQFVCDGYKASDNTFHFNWGWSGLYDGYYTTTGLNPAGAGTGGYSGGYNKNQSATIGIRPNVGSPHFVPLMCNTPIEYVAAVGSGFQVKLMAFMPYPEAQKIYLGARVENSGFSKCINMKTQTFPGVDLAEGELATTYYLTYNFSGEDIPDGVYTVYPIYKTDEMDWEDVAMPVSGNRCLYLKVSGGSMEMSASPYTETYATLTFDAEEEVADVYGADGTLLRRGLTEAEISELESGIYIIKTTKNKIYKKLINK